MTSIDSLTSEETAREEIIRIAELTDALLDRPYFQLPKSLPQPDFRLRSQGKQVLYFIVTTRTDCVDACQAFERIRNSIHDPDERSTYEIELYCLDLAVGQWLKNAVSSTTDGQ